MATAAWITFLTFTPIAPALAQGAAAAEEEPAKPKSAPVYKLDTSKDLDPNTWGKYTKKTASPAGGMIVRPGWGFYGDIRLGGLAQHQFIRVRLDLVMIGDVDGIDPVEGPDNWALQVRNGPLLLLTNFRNQGDDKRRIADGIGQSYPDEYPAGLHPIRTGAKNIGKFGFKQDATYVNSPFTAMELAQEDPCDAA